MSAGQKHAKNLYTLNDDATTNEDAAFRSCVLNGGIKSNIY